MHTLDLEQQRYDSMLPPDNSTTVSTHSRPKAAGYGTYSENPMFAFQLTAARRRLAMQKKMVLDKQAVSTHSRPKAAGRQNRRHGGNQRRFNSQPPEGGWARYSFTSLANACFNSQPPEGGWPVGYLAADGTAVLFQLTAARRRLAVCGAA